MKISIVTLNYKKKDMTADFLASLYTVYSREFEQGEMELFVVENGSEDGSAVFLKNEILSKKYKHTHLIVNIQNQGFAKGCNTGAARATGSYILFINNDTHIKTPGFLSMATCMDKQADIAIMGGKMIRMDGSPQLSAWKFYTLGNALLMLLGFERFGMLKSSPATMQQVEWVTGGCMMVRRKSFQELGGFDEGYFMYMEDMDLCYRAGKCGLKTYYYPDVTISHIGQGSSNRTFAIEHIYKGMLYFYKKNMPFWQYVTIKTCLYGKAVLLIAFGKLRNKPYYIQTYEKALTVF